MLKTAAILILVLLLLAAGAHIIIRTYVSSRAAEAIKTSIQQSYGEAVTFDALLFNLLYSQAEVENPYISFPPGSDGTEYALSAQNMVINIPARDLLQIPALAGTQFQITKGTVSMHLPVLTIAGPGNSAPLSIYAGSVQLDFSGRLTQHTLSQPASRHITSLMKEITSLDIRILEAVISAPDYSRSLYKLSELFSGSDFFNPEDASALILSMLPDRIIPPGYQTELLSLISRMDRDALYRTSRALEYLMPHGTGELIPSTVYLSIKALSENSDHLSARGSFENSAGTVTYDGIFQAFDPPGGTSAGFLEQLALQHIEIEAGTLTPEIASLLGRDFFAYSYGP